MKKYLFFLAITLSAIVFMGCSKDGGTKAKPVPTVNFSIGGVAYTWNEVTDDKDPNYMNFFIYEAPADTFHLSISNQFATYLIPGRDIFLSFPASTLAVNTPYTFVNTIPNNPFPPHDIVVATSNVMNPSYVYHASDVGDAVTVTITSLHDGLADGSFTGSLTHMSDQTKINISGNFKNVEIVH